MMMMRMSIRSIIRSYQMHFISPRLSQSMRGKSTTSDKSENQFETVFSLPTIKYMALINRLKVYHGFGAAIAVPTAGFLELYGALPENTLITVSFIGITGFALLALTSIPFKNVIGHLYISQDNKLIKISSIDFWGRRKDRIVEAKDWIPLLDMKPKTLDAIFLSPQLSDGTKYKLLLKYGKVLNSSKMGQVLE